MTDQDIRPRRVRRSGVRSARRARHASEIASGSLLVDRHLLSNGPIDTLVPAVARTVILVPHPDDEALATGGLIAHQRRRGLDVTVVAATDGDAAYPDWNGVELARVRRREQLDALALLGVGRTCVRRLEVPDGVVADHVDEIVDQLAEFVTADDVLVAPATFDWHPDHEACGRAAVRVAARTGCRLLGSLFWAHHHPDHAPPELRLAALPLTDEAVADRWEAVACHGSQLRHLGRSTADPILSRDVLGLLDRPVEYYVLGAGDAGDPLATPAARN